MYDNKLYDKPKTHKKGGCVVSVVPGEDKKATRIVIDDGTTFFDKKHGKFNQGQSYEFEFTISEYEGKTYNWLVSSEPLEGSVLETKEEKGYDLEKQPLIVRQSSNKLVSDLISESGRIMDKKYRNADYPADARKIIAEQLDICDELLNYVINKASIVDEAVMNGRKFN